MYLMQFLVVFKGFGLHMYLILRKESVLNCAM